MSRCFSRHRSLALYTVRVSLAVFMLLSAGVAKAQVSAEEQALVVARRAAENFREGNYERAVALLREAITLHETPALHYNLARTLVSLELWVEAQVAFARHLELEPESAQRPQIDAAIAEIETQQTRERALADAAAAAELDATQTPRAEGPVARGPSLAPWILLGSGAVVAAVGIPFVVLSDNAIDRARAAPSQEEAGPHVDAGRTHVVIADVLFAVGAAAAAAGLVWGIIDISGPELRVQPQGVGVAIDGRF